MPLAAWEVEKLCLGLGAHGRQIITLAARRGLRVERRGESWRFNGPGVDVAVAGLRYATTHDLLPVMPGRR